MDIYIIVSSFELKFCSIRNISTQLNQLITVKNNDVLRCDIPLSSKIWCIWFLSAANGDFLLIILLNITLKVSRTGMEIIDIAITGIFSGCILYKITSNEEGVLVM